MENREFQFRNADGEDVLILMRKCQNPGGKTSLPYLWYKHGYIDHILQTWWNMEVYVSDANGNCWGKYNPTVVEGQNKIDFNWMLEATDRNADRLIEECVRRANHAED